MKFLSYFTGLLVVGLVTSAHADDWSRFRGPNGSGVSTEKVATPDKWSPTSNLVWKAKLPGKGVSSPIVVGDKIFVTAYSGYGIDRGNPGNMDDLKRHLVCLDKKSGKEIWSKTIDPVLPEEPYSGMGVPAHGYASHTPVSDGKHVFAFFGRTGVIAFDLAGKKLWSKSVGKGDSPRRWGSASSPILYKDLVIVPATSESSSLFALKKENGEIAWKQEADGFYQSWSTPVLAKIDDDRTDLVIGVPYELWGINPLNGKLKWYAEVIESDSFYSSIVENEGVIYAVEGRRGGGGNVAIKAGGKGDIKKNTLWSGSDTGGFGSPVVVGGKVFHVAGGIVKCLDAKTGKSVYRARLEGGGSSGGGARGSGGGRRGRGGGGGAEYASPVSADGKVYFVNSTGQTFVFKADAEEFTQIAVNKVTEDREVFSATPAISGGMIFIRSDKHLYCVGTKKEEKKEASKE